MILAMGLLDPRVSLRIPLCQGVEMVRSSILTVVLLSMLDLLAGTSHSLLAAGRHGKGPPPAPVQKIGKPVEEVPYQIVARTEVLLDGRECKFDDVPDDVEIV